MAKASSTARTTLDPDEAAKFNRLAATWWDPKGSSAPLHAMNPARLGVIRDTLCAAFDRQTNSIRPLSRLSILDLGCGGGLVSEPLARMGADVTAIDGAAEAIAVARQHSLQSGLEIDYRCTTAEELEKTGARFDAVVSLEVIEHVADVPLYLASIYDLLKPGGVAILSTLNRTAQSWLTAILGAEYVLRLLPRGTHDWQKFLTPEELSEKLLAAGFVSPDVHGLSFDPIKASWYRSSSTSVNYILSATRQTIPTLG
jgi:2-polyprenyl-6-hydroxyphenyl methylase / 3-demethylubiquinone-9 3-methyltransferase